MERLSIPIEQLIGTHSPDQTILEAEYVVVGSGYGGAISALRLAGADRHGDVVVLERGREYLAGDFPRDEGDLPSHVSVTIPGSPERGYSSALFNIHAGDDVNILSGSGLGGTSLINANVAEVPEQEIFEQPAWPRSFRSGKVNLAEDYDKIRELLSVNRHPAPGFGKVQALKRLSEAVDKQPGTKASCDIAQVAVSFTDGPNNVGFTQRACTDCGNCVTGCNVGAKNTLDRNILPLAKARGAEIFTGVSVMEVIPLGGSKPRWRLRVTLTDPPKNAQRTQSWWIDTNNIILAAGTLGSTGILLRSTGRNGFQASSRLGQGFSTNGDGLVMGYAQDTAVNSLAGARQLDPPVAQRVGPTITGITRVTAESGDGETRLVLEDAAIPAAITRIFAESITLSAQLQRLEKPCLPKFIRRQNSDPLIASTTLARHSQALLVMGEDGAGGQIRLDPAGRLRVEFPDAAKNRSLVTANRLVKSQDRKAGLDGGQYAPNPLWQLMPEGARTAMSGEFPSGRALTVHPLGGCCMGDDIDSGVVDHCGRVFRPDANKATAVWDGLYVADGAIIPSALAVNPFLTISALAWRNAGFILARDGLIESSLNTVSGGVNAAAEPDVQCETVAFTFSEQMTGRLDADLPGFLDTLPAASRARLRQVQGLVIEVRAKMPDFSRWLEAPGPLPATARLFVNPLSEEAVLRMHPYGVVPAHLLGQTPIDTLEGTFSLLVEDHHRVLRRIGRATLAILAYMKRRMRPRGGLSIVISKIGAFIRGLPGSLKALPGLILAIPRGFRSLIGFCGVAWVQGRYRRMAYRLASNRLSLVGDKVIAYGLREERMAPSLINLPFELRDIESGECVSGRASVNLERMVQSGFLQLDKAPHLPRAMLGALGIGGFFMRTLLATNFWEFGRNDTPPGRVRQKTTPVLLKLGDDRSIEPAFHTVEVPLRRDAEDTWPMLMTHYENRDAASGPVLLVHGLAQGSQIYWTDTIETNLAQYFYKQGYDVWLVDYRLSNHVLPGIADQDWSIDEIAEFDIPMATRYVMDATGKNLTVFAHCVGACSFAMAVLKGRIDTGRIKRVAINAIHPWVITSPANRVRAKLGAFYRDWIKASFLDPIPKPDDGAALNVLDRLAFIIARVAEQPQDDHAGFNASQFSDSICDRMTLLYGRMWNHKNLSRKTHDAFVHMLGDAPVGVYNHMYYYALLRRITDKDGRNEYLRLDNVTRNWTFPTMFLHGNDSGVFNPYSARRSAANLTEITGRSEICANVVKDYGHMDVIIGKSAAVDVYPDVVEFLKGAPNECEDSVLGEVGVNDLNLGPVLRAAWREAGRLRLRYWGELKVDLSEQQTEMAVAGHQVSQVFEGPVHIGAEAAGRHRMLDLEVTGDVTGGLSFALYGEIKKGDARRLPANFHYDDQAWLHRFRNGPAEFRFMVGSCRFPGTVIDERQSDRIYRSMAAWVDRVHLQFLVGDQIYADATDQLFKVKSLRSKYRYRYQRVFDKRYSPAFAALVRQLPTHFALDDHEIDDGWSGLPDPADMATQMELGRYGELQAMRDFGVENAMRFQSSWRDERPVGASGNPFYYALSCPDETDLPMFVMDTRTEREFRQANAANAYEMISRSQRDSLFAWLKDARDRFEDEPKFIFSGSILAPLPDWYIDEPARWRQLDGWAGYPATMETVLGMIMELGVKKVVFVGGNEHYSAAARLQLRNAAGEKLCAWQLVASGFYAPLPFANNQRADYTWESGVEYPMHLSGGLTLTCDAYYLTGDKSHFMVVTPGADSIGIEVVDAENASLGGCMIDFGNNSIARVSQP